MKLFTTMFLSATLIFSTMAVKPAEAHGRRGAAIAAGAIILGLGIAAAAAEDRHYPRHYRRQYYRPYSDCDRYGCYYHDEYGNLHYRGGRIYEEYRYD